MGYVPLLDALGLLALYAAEDSPKYDKAATRWLARLALDVDDLRLSDVQLAAAALQALPDAALRVLTGLTATASSPTTYIKGSRPRAASHLPRATTRARRGRRRRSVTADYAFWNAAGKPRSADEARTRRPVHDRPDRPRTPRGMQTTADATAIRP
jgi:hypothetical protein